MAASEAMMLANLSALATDNPESLSRIAARHAEHAESLRSRDEDLAGPGSGYRPNPIRIMIANLLSLGTAQQGALSNVQVPVQGQDGIAMLDQPEPDSVANARAICDVADVPDRDEEDVK
jgi:hypothetical protein